MQWKKHFMLLITSILLVGILTACGNSEKDEAQTGENEEKKVLKLGTSADYAPFEFVDTAKSDEIIGLDIDIVNAIADKLGYEIQAQDIDFNSLPTALENGTVDLVASAMNATEERKKTLDFSDNYYSAANMIVTTKDSTIKTVEDLKGKTVGVQLASVQEELATKLNKDGITMTIEKRNRVNEIVQELMVGRVDAAIIEDEVAKGHLANNETLVAHTIETDEEAEGYAIAFPKNSDLTEQFNAELKKMKESGELDELIAKWMKSETK
ncbi:transporter substrate-binding domain-containing protein [Peribacillus asahii]|uniref:transporter substrate-binding domain-containing protein n=1 Tax=Peribacillus asahii TaxID=228899 RepID=UPI00207985EE|nr:transporter substrate-binding domain-containing protein [Peribacillus asahii]USK58724.1 transporter substrate-binding domain-containing protein [Peribacillus asahii]